MILLLGFLMMTGVAVAQQLQVHQMLRSVYQAKKRGIIMEQNKISRRNFLRVAGASATAAAMGGLVPAASAAGIDVYKRQAVSGDDNIELMAGICHVGDAGAIDAILIVNIHMHNADDDIDAAYLNSKDIGFIATLDKSPILFPLIFAS